MTQEHTAIEVTQARCTCMEIEGENPDCALHGDIAYLIALALRTADEGIVHPPLEDPQDWLTRRWEEIGCDPDEEITANPLVAYVTRRRLAQPSITPAAELVEAGCVWLRERAQSCKDEAVARFERDDEEAGEEWRVRGETYGFVADQIERGYTPFTTNCGDPGASLCSACSQPITELTQQPGCGVPLSAPTTEPQPASPSGLTIDDARAVDRLLRFHETGGHEGDGGDANLSAVRSTLAKMLALAAPATADDATPPEQPASNTVRDLKSWAEMQDDNAEIVACGERWKVIAAGVGMTVHGYDSDYRASFYNPDGGVVEVGPKLRAIFAALSPPPAGQTGVDEGQ